MGTKKRFPGLYYREVQMHSQDAVKLNDAIKANEGYTKKIEYSAYDFPQPDVNLDERVHSTDKIGESNWFKKTVEEVTPVRHTVTFSCTNGSVGATVDGIGIQSGTQVIAGKTVVFTITPDEGYEYTGTNPETVVVTADVTKSYVCTQPIPYLCFTSAGATTVKLVASPYMEDGVEVVEPNAGWQWSYDKSTWNELVPLTTIVPLIDGQSMYVKGSEPFENRYNFKVEGDGTVAVSGDVTTLINEVGGVTNLSDVSQSGTFKGLFTSNPKITSVNLTLPSTTLVINCYYNMFDYCPNMSGTVNIAATSPYYLGTSSACLFMFQDAGTEEGAGGTIKVGGNANLWNYSNCRIDTSKWTVELITEDSEVAKKEEPIEDYPEKKEDPVDVESE